MKFYSLQSEISEQKGNQMQKWVFTAFDHFFFYILDLCRYLIRYSHDTWGTAHLGLRHVKKQPQRIKLNSHSLFRWTVWMQLLRYNVSKYKHQHKKTTTVIIIVQHTTVFSEHFVTVWTWFNADVSCESKIRNLVDSVTFKEFCLKHQKCELHAHRSYVCNGLCI